MHGAQVAAQIRDGRVLSAAEQATRFEGFASLQDREESVRLQLLALDVWDARRTLRHTLTVLGLQVLVALGVVLYQGGTGRASHTVRPSSDPS